MAQGRYDELWEAAWDQAASIGPGFRSRYRLLLNLLQSTDPSGKLLDVGAGRGHFLKAVHGRFPNLDLSAHENAAGALAHLRTLPFVGDVLSGDLSAESATADSTGFDLIVCSEVLEHVKKHEEALDAMVDLLRPGGHLILTVPLRPDLWNQVDEAVGHQRRYQRGELDGLCRARGLLIEESLSVGAPFYNTYYRLLGRRPPQETARTANRLGARTVARILTAAFSLEMLWSTPWGARGALVARKGGRT